MDAFFPPPVDGWFTPNENVRGPWDIRFCHGGPIAALIAWSLEDLAPDKQLTRLTIDLIRPVPMDGFRLDTEITRQGRTVTTTACVLTDRRDKVCAKAAAMHLAEVDIGDVPNVEISGPVAEEMTPGVFPLGNYAHDLPNFAKGAEIAYPPGEDSTPGPTTVWMRTVPLFEGQPLSAFQKICPLADCGNGISRNEEIGELSFVNPDITIVMHRKPVGDWIASQAVSHWHSNGIGAAESTLFDAEGPVGVATQTLVIRRDHAS